VHQQPPRPRPPQGPTQQPPRQGYPPQGYPQQGYAQEAPRPVFPPPTPPRKRGMLRFLGGACVGSAWLTLVLSVIAALMSFGTGASFARGKSLASGSTTNYFPPQPGYPGLDDPFAAMPGMGAGPGGGLGLADLMSTLQGMAAPMMFVSGITALVGGIITFLLLLGAGQACYALIDLEERLSRTEQVLHAVASRVVR
jgi:hypothetical protein